MKQCLSCGRLYDGDLSFCLDDGKSLVRVVEAPSSDPRQMKTEVLRADSFETSEAAAPTIPIRVAPTAQPEPRRPSRLPYVVIGMLAFACVMLAFTLLVLNRDRLFSADSSNRATASPSPVAVSPTPVPTIARAAATPVANIGQAAQSNKAAANITGSGADPVGKWRGEWSTTSGSLFDFELTLTSTGGRALDGQIRWTMRRTARPDKADKVGFSATEFVRGSYDPATQRVDLAGYDKSDPNGMLVMLDVYQLNLSSDGRTLNGLARNGGKWNGHVRLSR